MKRATEIKFIIMVCAEKVCPAAGGVTLLQYHRWPPGGKVGSKAVMQQTDGLPALPTVSRQKETVLPTEDVQQRHSLSPPPPMSHWLVLAPPIVTPSSLPEKKLGHSAFWDFLGHEG